MPAGYCGARIGGLLRRSFSEVPLVAALGGGVGIGSAAGSSALAGSITPACRPSIRGPNTGRVGSGTNSLLAGASIDTFGGGVIRRDRGPAEHLG